MIFSIRSKIYFAFFLTILLTGGGLLYIQYRTFKAAAYEGAGNTFHLHMAKIASYLKDKETMAKLLLHELCYDPIPFPTDTRLFTKKAQYFLEPLKSVYAFHISYPDGKAIIFRSLEKDGSLMYEVIPFMKKNGKRMKIVEHYDDNFRLLDHYDQKNLYDPRDRPWHRLAMAHPNQTVRSRPYRFNEKDEFGITYARQCKHGEVIAFDVLINFLDKNLKKFRLLPNLETYTNPK